MKVWGFLLVMVMGLTSVCFAQKVDTKAPKSTNVSKPAVKTIFDYQKELGLSAKQIEDIKALTANLQKTMTDKAKEILALRQEVQAMIVKKDKVELIREKLQKIASIQVDNSCLDIETGRKVEAVMTPEQLKKWQDIQAKFREAAVAKMKANKAKAKPKVTPPAKAKK